MTSLGQLADRHERLYQRHSDMFGTQERNSVALIADTEYLRTFAGQVTWAVLANLTARLYKGIHRLCIVVEPEIERLPRVFFPNSKPTIRDASVDLIKALHPDASFLEERGMPEGTQWIRVYVGGACAAGDDALSVAGRGWGAFINDQGWKLLPDDGNPIGALVAACLGAAEIYKRLYAMRSADFRKSTVFSAYDYSVAPEGGPSLPREINLPRTFIPGAGAIGMAVLLLLHSLPVHSSNGLLPIDFDHLDDTNLNRCILAVLADLNPAQLKIDIVKARVDAVRLGLDPQNEHWEEFAKRSEYADPRSFERIISCVDRYEARRAVQYLKPPRILFTGGTGDFLLNVSRHILDDGLACGLCYQARDPEPACATASDGSQHAFEAPIDPSIGFVSVLAGILLGVEYLKEIIGAPPLRNHLRVKTLFAQASVRAREKDPNCNCSSKFVAAGYKATWR
jgi:molybdopterin/thiamine biosynthesis adenylyltransferase